MNKRSSRDLLSDLPLDIIHAILQRIPIREAVRTCILSSKWKYKWVSLPHLTFNDSNASSSEFGLECLITQILVLHQGPVLKFKVDSQSLYIFVIMDKWLRFLSRNGIRMLSLKFYPEDYSAQLAESNLSGVYSCQNLTHLEIRDANLPPPPPSFEGFLCLKFLVLYHVNVSSANTLQTLVGDLPLLEKMVLFSPTRLNEGLRINAPNLKNLYLRVTGDVYIQAPLLSEMLVWLGDIPQKKGLVCKYTELLGGLTRLEKLSGNNHFLQYLSFRIESCSGSLVFPHLRVIEVVEFAFEDDDDANVHWMKAIKCLLASSPVLEKLVCYSLLRKDASTLLNYPRASPNAKIFCMDDLPNAENFFMDEQPDAKFFCRDD